VADLVESYQSDPVVIEVGPKEVSMDSMEHIFWKVDSSNKLVLSEYISQNFSPSIIFCKTRAGSNRLGKQLTDLGASVAVLHGGMNQKQRDRSMRKFSAQNVRTLIATDVASRGIDIQGVNCVLHFDPPENGKAYKHRSGRTARAGKKGIVVSLVQRSQMRYYKRIQKQVGISSEITEPRPELLDFEIGQVDPREGGVGGSAKNRRRKKKNDHGTRKEGRDPGNKKRIKKKNGGRHRQRGAKPKQKRRRRT
jgi:superfamily II DNA/RNA helicase